MNCHHDGLPDMHAGLAGLKRELVRVGVISAEWPICCCDGDDPEKCNNLNLMPFECRSA